MSPKRLPGKRGGNPCYQGAFGGFDEALVLGPRDTNDHTSRRIGDPPVNRHRDIHSQQVRITQYIVMRQPMQHRIVDRQADDVRNGPRPNDGA